MSIKIQNLSKRFDNQWVLKDVSLEAEKGEILGVFGLTGVGKTTLIRTITGIEPASGGTIFVNEMDLTHSPCEKRGISFPTITNDSFWKSVFKTQRRSELADGDGQQYALDTALEEVEHTLLLDNSFCQMDKQMRLENYEKLRRKVCEKNLTVIFTTNDHEEIFQVCDRVAVLHDGVIKQVGTPREVYENPNSATVAGVFGRNNLFPARRISKSTSEIPQFLTINGEHRLLTDGIEKNRLGAITQNIMLAIRPEHISISFGASFPGDNLLKAVVTDVDYLGATTIIELDAEGLRLESMVLRLVGLHTGDECVVGLPPERISILKD